MGCETSSYHHDITELGTKGLISKERYARFHKLLAELGILHDSKGADYDGNGPEYGNHKALAEWGVASWKSPLFRVNEKMKRLQTFAKTGKINYDGVEDSLKDIAVLSLIALILFREEHDG